MCSLIGTIIEKDTEVDDYCDGKTLYCVNRHHPIIVMKYTDLIIKPLRWWRLGIGSSALIM